MPKCIICHERPADIEGVICYECKREQDEINIQNEMMMKMEEELLYDHSGQSCWLDGKPFCQPGWCAVCKTFIDWREKYAKE